jgi:hypothetical protein
MNKQKFYCFLLLLLCGMGHLPCTAQQYFNKRYTLNASNNLLTNALQKGNKYYAINGCLDSINYLGSGKFINTYGLKFVVFDSTSNVLTSKLFQRADKAISYGIPAGVAPSNNLMAMNDGTFLFSFCVVDTARAVYNPSFLNYQLSIIRFDSLGNVLMYKEYDRAYCLTTDATNHILMDFKPDAYGNWLMLSSMLCNGNRIVFNLRKLDSTFNEIWVKNFTTNIYHHTPKHLLIEDDGYVMTGGIDNGNAKLHPDYYSSLLIKCDTAGNKLWDWQNSFDTTKLQYIINDIIRSKDGGYIYCGTGEGRPTYFDGKTDWSGIQVKGWVEKLDASRNRVWKRSFGAITTSVNKIQQTVIKEMPNGDITIAGSDLQFWSSSNPDYAWTRGSLARLKGTDGSIIWQRLYKVAEDDTLRLNIYDMRQTEDGGFILAGEAYNLIDRGKVPIQRGWLIKVDSNGCEWAGSPCNPTHINPLQTSLGAGFRVYPNPASNSINLSIAANELKVYNTLGQIVLQTSNIAAQQPISVSELCSGLYYLVLYDKEKNKIGVAKFYKE